MIAEYTRASPDAVRVGAAPEMHFRHARLCHMWQDNSPLLFTAPVFAFK